MPFIVSFSFHFLFVFGMMLLSAILEGYFLEML